MKTRRKTKLERACESLLEAWRSRGGTGAANMLASHMAEIESLLKRRAGLVALLASVWCGSAQVLPGGGGCTNCLPTYVVNPLTNDTLYHFDPARRIPFDTNFSLNTWQWYLRADTNALHVFDALGNYLPNYDEANAATHHDISTLWLHQPHASNQVVAVIDSGLHGRWCASVLGSPAGDGEGLAGAGRGVQLRRYETVAYGSSEVTAQIRAAVADGAGVISMSFGYTSSTKPTNVIAAMREASNVVFCLSALNGVGPEDTSRDWLCKEQLPNALCVTAIAKGGELFGAYGTNISTGAAGRRVPVDDTAFGTFIPAPLSFGGEPIFGEPRTLSSQTGTSLAAPLVAGVVAHLREAYPSETAAQMCERIRVSNDPGVSVPHLNAFRALQWTRVPKLTIDRTAVYAAAGVGQSAVVEQSSDLNEWVALTNIIGTGWPQPVAGVSSGQKFYRMR